MMVPLFRGIGLNAKWKSIYKKELIYQILCHLCHKLEVENYEEMVV